jgi:radical SAM superfamily enzyme YgiQ (UPF0313 family)
MTYAVILSVPRVAPVRPAAAPAIIKSILKQHNKSSRILDLNLEYFTQFNQTVTPDIFTEIDDHLFLPNRVLGESAQEKFNEFLQHCVNKVLALEPEKIFLSVFTWQAQKFTRCFLTLLKQQSTAEVIIGGQGLIYAEHGSYSGSPDFAHEMKSLGLIDHWIRGEAESTVPHIVNGRYDVPGVNTDTLAPTSDVATHAYLDFDDFDINSYQSGFDHGVLPMETSRGCFRKCVFCDIPTMAGGYRVKPGRRLAEELIYYYERYNVRNFFFHDALCNGDIPVFREFNQTLLDYYQTHNLPDRFLNYSSHAVIHNAKNFTAQDFELQGRAGADAMAIGIETGSDRVRNDMKKGFTNQDLDFTIEMYSRYGIKMYFLMIVGYPTETDEDFQQTLDMLTRYQRYVADGTIIGVNFNTTFTVEHGTTIHRDYKKFRIVGIEQDQPQGTDWRSLDNPELTYKKRILRRIQAQEHAVKLGYTFWKGDDQMKILMERYKDRLSKYAGVIH